MEAVAVRPGLHKRLMKILPDETKVFRVDGSFVRDHYLLDWTMGGHSLVYDFIPDDEIWIEKMEDSSEEIFNLAHELFERRLMKDQGLDYEDAHARAIEYEEGLRRHYRPQESKVGVFVGKRIAVTESVLTKRIIEEIFDPESGLEPQMQAPEADEPQGPERMPEEEPVYTLERFMQEGKSRGNGEPKHFDPEQIEMGMQVEVEHTSNPEVARKIAEDHLTEIPDYYTRLKAVEEQAKSGGDSNA